MELSSCTYRCALVFSKTYPPEIVLHKTVPAVLCKMNIFLCLVVILCEFRRNKCGFMQLIYPSVPVSPGLDNLQQSAQPDDPSLHFPFPVLLQLRTSTKHPWILIKNLHAGSPYGRPTIARTEAPIANGKVSIGSAASNRLQDNNGENLKV